MNTKYVPAIIMLSAGFVDCIMAIMQHKPLLDFTKELLLVLVIFLVIGCVVKMVIDKTFRVDEEKEQLPENSEEEQQDVERKEQQTIDETEE